VKVTAHIHHVTNYRVRIALLAYPIYAFIIRSLGAGATLCTCYVG